MGALHTDVTKVRQILLNLLSNAAKFTERGNDHAGGAAPPAGRSVAFAVRDTGIGMTAEQWRGCSRSFPRPRPTRAGSTAAPGSAWRSAESWRDDGRRRDGGEPRGRGLDLHVRGAARRLAALLAGEYARYRLPADWCISAD